MKLLHQIMFIQQLKRLKNSWFIALTVLLVTGSANAAQSNEARLDSIGDRPHSETVRVVADAGSSEEEAVKSALRENVRAFN